MYLFALSRFNHTGGKKSGEGVFTSINLDRTIVFTYEQNTTEDCL